MAAPQGVKDHGDVFKEEQKKRVKFTFGDQSTIRCLGREKCLCAIFLCKD